MIDFLNQSSETWLRTFGLVVAQNTLFLAVVLLVLQALRRVPARVRHGVATIGLLKLLLPPFLPATMTPSPAEALQALISSPAMIPLGGLGAVGGRPSDPSVASATTEPLSIAGLLLALWIMSVLGFLALSGLSTARLWWTLRDAAPINADATLARTGVRLYQSRRLTMPLCIGVLPQRIYVPAAWDRWSPERRHLVIRHELAHIERRDGLSQMLQILAQALYLFHPLVWVLNRRVCEYREMACDDRATDRRQGSCLEYSRHLVDIAEAMVRSSLPHHSASTLIRTPHELRHRITYQLKEGSMSPISRKTLVTTVIILVAMVLPLSWYPGGAGSGTSAATGIAVSGHTIVELTLASDDVTLVNGREIDPGDLTPILEAAAGSDPDRVVVQIGCEADVTMGTLHQVQESLRGAGLSKVNYLTSQGKGLPLMLPRLETTQPVPDRHLARLSIGQNGDVQLDQSPIEVDAVPDAIIERLTADEYLVVVIEATEATPYHDFIAVLGRVKAAGAPRIMVGGPGD